MAAGMVQSLEKDATASSDSSIGGSLKRLLKGEVDTTALRKALKQISDISGVAPSEEKDSEKEDECDEEKGDEKVSDEQGKSLVCTEKSPAR